MSMIKSVKVNNWKVYTHPHNEYFHNGLNVICRSNGSGKTSIFQAIMLTMFNILPSNSTLTSMANNPTTETSITVTLSNGLVFSREFINGKTTKHAVYDNSGKKLTGTSKEVITLAEENLGDKSIIAALWSNTGTCLSWKFFQTNILSALLADPTTISTKLRSKIYQIKKEVAPLSPRTSVELERLIRDTEKALSQTDDAQSAITAAQYGLAIESQSAWEKLQTMSKPTMTLHDAEKITLIAKRSQSDMRELAKYSHTAEIMTKLGPTRATAASGENYLSYLRSNGCEPISQIKVDVDIITGLEKVGRYLTLKKKAEESTHAQNLLLEAKSAITYWKTKALIRLQNWEEVIAQYNKDNEESQARRGKLLSTYRILTKELEDRKRLDKLKENLDHLQEMKAWVDDYLITATSAYSQSFLAQCNLALKEFSDRYTSIDLYNGVFYLTKTNGQIITVGQMSSGERGIVDTIIRLAISRMTGTPIPLLFDESFANMDIENLTSVKTVMENAATKGQIFVVTHNESWRKEIE